MSHVDEYIYVHKFLNGQMSSDQIKEYNNWLKQEENAQLAEDIQKIWINAQEVDYPEFDYNQALEKHKSYLKSENEKIQKNTKIISLNKKWYLAIAASLLFIISSIFLFKNSTNEIYEFNNTRIVLADNTNVWLDKDSKIEVKYSDNSRNIILSGKAYFNVYHDKQRPFKITCEDVDVTVLGTSFIIDGLRKIISVKSGQVKLANKDYETILKENQKVSYEGKEEFFVENFSFDEESLWFNDELKFNNTPLDKVISDISAFYGVKINLNLQKDWLKCPFSSGSLIKNNFQEVLEILKASYDMEYEYLQDNSVIVKKVNCK